MTPNLFLSYARIKDYYHGVSQFKEHLEWAFRLQTGDKNFSVFQDKNEILAGEHFDVVIEDTLKVSQALIVLYSPTWFASDYCKKEFRYFRERNPSRPVVVLKWGDVDLDGTEDDDTVAIYKELSKVHHYEWGINLQYGEWDSPELKIAASKLVTEIVTLLKKTNS